MSMSKGLDELTQRVLLRAFVTGLASLLELARHLDPRLSRSVRDLRASYEFRYGRAARQLVLDGRRIRTRRAAAFEADYAVAFVDLPGAVTHLARNPGDVLRLQLENKVNPSGNVHYLFQLGYLLGLVAQVVENRWPSWLWPQRR